MKHPRIFILLLNWNGKRDTLECLASLEKVDYPNFQTLVVDNGSSDDSVPAIRAAFPNVLIDETHANLGFAGGNNVGIEWVLKHHAEWIFLLNNDTIVAPDLLHRFLEAAQKQPKAKILGAKIYRYSDPQRIDHLGGSWNPKIVEFDSYAYNQLDNPYYSDMRPVDYVCGAALFMHASVPKTIGLLEPRFFLFWEETDYCFRARRAGFEVWTAPEAKVWHKVSASFTGGKPHMQYFWWRSRLLWLERNCSAEERRELYKKVIFPELFKTLRHYLLRSLQNFLTRTRDPVRLEKAKRYKAGCMGALDYYRRKFGNCPAWLVKKK
ncbi:MAG TPA: glycosyltransferase family 2 protein [Chlamydiales bacterium]|nr:glycosyltransferase family 2 protein [Chlamydiales bacterium]